MAKPTPVYLDYNATTPVKGAVADLMSALLRETGNASSVHGFGRAARHHVETARAQVASLVQAHPNQVTFTSGATEANNTVLQAFRDGTIWISAGEHPSVSQAGGAEAVLIPLTPQGTLDLAAFERMLREMAPPSLISVHLVNNETGVIQPVADMARLARRYHRDVYIHTDAAQAPGRIPIDFPALQADYLSLSAHKFGGPQGTGALIAAPGARPARLLYGGGQEKRQRAGTENIAGIGGFGLAADLALSEFDTIRNITAMRDELEKTLRAESPELVIFGAGAPRAGNTSSLCLPGIPAELQLMNLDLAGFAVSNGSACSSGKVEPSHVLKAMGADDVESTSTLRISLGWGTNPDDMSRFAAAWSDMYRRLKGKIVHKSPSAIQDSAHA